MCLSERCYDRIVEKRNAKCVSCVCFTFVFMSKVEEKLTAMKVAGTYSSSVEASDAAATTPLIIEEMAITATIVADALLDAAISRSTLR